MKLVFLDVRPCSPTLHPDTYLLIVGRIYPIPMCNPLTRIPNSSVTFFSVTFSVTKMSGQEVGALNFSLFGLPKQEVGAFLDCTDAWVTRPERPKVVKDVIKQARRAAA